MSCSRRLVILAFYPFSSHDFLITKSGTLRRVVSDVQPGAFLKFSGERSLYYNVCDSPTCALFGLASQPAQSPPRGGDRPSSGQVSRMCKTAVCGRVHVAHDHRCLPGEGRQVKTWLLTRRRGWRSAAKPRHPRAVLRTRAVSGHGVPDPEATPPSVTSGLPVVWSVARSLS